jgi:hypothetical protein
MSPFLDNQSLRLNFLDSGQQAIGFKTEIHDGQIWLPAINILNRPVNTLAPQSLVVRDQVAILGGKTETLAWETTIQASAHGFALETVLKVQETLWLDPSMILWIDTLDNLNDRQAHTWRQTILRAPTTNQQGLAGNDLPACYLYDHATGLETICYYPPDSFAWTPNRFYGFSMREVLSYQPQPTGRYGLGLVPNAPDHLYEFEPGTHKLVWWFTQRRRQTVPTLWAAQRALVDTIAPLFDPNPVLMNDAIPWRNMAQHTLDDLSNEACWIDSGGTKGLRAYVLGSSAVKRDQVQGFELMTQLDVLWPLLLWKQITGATDSDPVVEQLKQTIMGFQRQDWNYVANNYPPHDGDSFMDTWYFLENALIKLAWVAYLTADETLKDLFFSALAGAQQLAQHTKYLFPLFADANGWQPRPSLLNVSVGGLYAAGCVLAYQLNANADHLYEAGQALLTMHQLPPHMLTHEPQQLSFAAAAANYLARIGYDPLRDWRNIAEDFVYLTLRMGYWGRDPAVPFYDPRGMFQACASLCYPAYKENVETLLPWSELLNNGVGPIKLMAEFANLQRCHNYAFFDPYLPREHRHGPCPHIPWEDLGTAEFNYTAVLGKELYGAGEVFWSALLFDALGHVEERDVLCLSLDVPTLELKSMPPANQRRYLLYNPTPTERRVVLNNTLETREMILSAHSAAYAVLSKG